MPDKKWTIGIESGDSWYEVKEVVSRTEAIENGVRMAKKDGTSKFKIGVKTYVKVPGIALEKIIELLQNDLVNEVGLSAEGYLDDISESDGLDLETAVNFTIYNWIKKKGYEPKQYVVSDIETIQVVD